MEVSISASNSLEHVLTNLIDIKSTKGWVDFEFISSTLSTECPHILSQCHFGYLICSPSYLQKSFTSLACICCSFLILLIPRSISDYSRSSIYTSGGFNYLSTHKSASKREAQATSERITCLPQNLLALPLTSALRSSSWPFYFSCILWAFSSFSLFKWTITSSTRVTPFPLFRNFESVICQTVKLSNPPRSSSIGRTLRISWQLLGPLNS